MTYLVVSFIQTKQARTHGKQSEWRHCSTPRGLLFLLLPLPLSSLLQPPPRPHVVTQPKHCFRLCSKKKLASSHCLLRLFLSSYLVPRQQESRSGHLSPCIKLQRLKAGLSGMFHFQVDIDALAGSSGVVCV